MSSLSPALLDPLSLSFNAPPFPPSCRNPGATPSILPSPSRTPFCCRVLSPLTDISFSLLVLFPHTPHLYLSYLMCKIHALVCRTLPRNAGGWACVRFLPCNAATAQKAEIKTEDQDTQRNIIVQDCPRTKRGCGRSSSPGRSALRGARTGKNDFDHRRHTRGD